MRNVTLIPATIKRYQNPSLSLYEKRKVAGYARVSTDTDDQQNSYEAQVKYYTDYISSREDWQFVKIYTDEGISGTSIKKRPGFQEMIKDALSGKIDLIVTKSVSRFARNTVDSLTTIRKLKENNIECYFEKENIWTFDGKGEMLITIMSSLAQEESRSISENCTWGQRKRMADGKVSVCFNQFLGYDRGENGEFVVNPEEAETVKRIYRMYAQGFGITTIAQELTNDRVKTAKGNYVWNPASVRSILKNEKYKGDALLQKTYTKDFLTKKQIKNKGEVQQYYVTENHEAIISPEVFDLVQDEMKRRGKQHGKRIDGLVFVGKIKCANCGGTFSRFVWHSTDRYKKYVWHCYNRYTGKNKRCQTGNLKEEDIKDFCLKEINNLLAKKDFDIMDELREVLDTTELKKKYDKLCYELQAISSQIENVVKRSARTAENTTDKYDALVKEYEKKRKESIELSNRIKDMEERLFRAEDFTKELRKLNKPLEKFDDEIFIRLVDHLEVESSDNIKIVWRGEV